MSKRVNLALVVIFVATLTDAQVPGIGKCPDAKPMHDFDVTRYLGTWFEVKKYPFIFTIGGKCITADYGLNSNGSLSVVNKQIRDGRESSIVGTAVQTEPGAGSLIVSFPSAPFQTKEPNYNVLETDYENYAVVYACNVFFHLVNTKTVWILSRTRTPAQSILDRAYDVLRINGLSTAFLATTENNECPDEALNNVDQFFRN